QGLRDVRLTVLACSHLCLLVDERFKLDPCGVRCTHRSLSPDFIRGYWCSTPCQGLRDGRLAVLACSHLCWLIDCGFKFDPCGVRFTRRSLSPDFIRGYWCSTPCQGSRDVRLAVLVCSHLCLLIDEGFKFDPCGVRFTRRSLSPDSSGAIGVQPLVRG